jgi:hypothetical protein
VGYHLSVMEAGELAIRRVRPEWCAVDTGGVLICLYLTAVRAPWIPDMLEVVREAAARRHGERVPAMSVISPDKRFPLDIGFDAQLHRLRKGVGEIAPLLGASAFVLEVDGFLATTMVAAIASLGRLSRTEYPRSVHPTVVAAATWLAPHVVPQTDFRGVRHYADAVHRMKTELGAST